MVGTTRARVNFFMNRFRQLGLIDYNGGLEVHSSLLDIVLHDWMVATQKFRHKLYPFEHFLAHLNPAVFTTEFVATVRFWTVPALMNRFRCKQVKSVAVLRFKKLARTFFTDAVEKSSHIFEPLL
jgi:hypothetical protein